MRLAGIEYGSMEFAEKGEAMKIQKTICDRCGCEIQSANCYMMYPQVIDTESRDILAIQPYAEEMSRDYCEDCIQEIMEFLHEGF